MSNGGGEEWMKQGELTGKRTRRARYGQALLAIGIAAALLQPYSTAEAGLLDRVKDIYQLPEQLEGIQKEFDSTKQQLEEQKDKLAETMRQSKEAQDRLIAQNKQLLEQNEALQSRIQAMEQTALDKNARTRKITTIAVTAVILVIGYFVLGRVLRITVWRRQKRKLRQ
jgi:CHASE3 domain sensor protein